MTPSALLWFVDLCAHDVYAPGDAQTLGRKLQKHLDSKNDRIQVNRVFRRYTKIIPTIYAWLTSAPLVDAIRKKGCSVTSSAYSSALAAIEAILAGEAPTNAWGMGKVRGVDAGISRILEAVALAGYLSKDLYSKSAAQRHASCLLGVNEDNVRKYVGIKPMSAKSEAALALSALVTRGMLAEADKYFDVDDLKEFVADRNVTI